MGTDVLIRVVRHMGVAPDAEIKAVFGRAGGTLGRSVECALVLPDPQKYISRVQAEVAWSDDAFFLVDRGTVNSTQVNGSEVGSGQRVELHDGDELYIGDYVLRVEVVRHVATDGNAPRAVIRDRLPADAQGEASGNLAAVVDRVAAMYAHDFKPDPVTLITRFIEERNHHSIEQEADGQSHDAQGRLLEAFLLGAGLSGLPSGSHAKPGTARGLNEVIMKRIGVLLRVFAQGAIETLNAQASATDGNAARPASANPAEKFSDASAMLMHLLVPQGKSGFPGAEKTIHQIFDGLLAHEDDVRESARAALTGILERVTPEALERQLPNHPMLDAMLPINRKARLWDLFCETFDRVLKEHGGNTGVSFNQDCSTHQAPVPKPD